MKLFPAVWLPLAIGLGNRADVLHPANGKVQQGALEEGEIVRVRADTVTAVDFSKGETSRVPMAEVMKITFDGTVPSLNR